MQRSHIYAPYKCWNGFVVTCQQHIDDYNQIQDNINIWVDACRDVPEWLLDWSHRKFVEISRS